MLVSWFLQGSKNTCHHTHCSSFRRYVHAARAERKEIIMSGYYCSYIFESKSGSKYFLPLKLLSDNIEIVE